MALVNPITPKCHAMTHSYPSARTHTLPGMVSLPLRDPGLQSIDKSLAKAYTPS